MIRWTRDSSPRLVLPSKRNLVTSELGDNELCLQSAMAYYNYLVSLQREPPELERLRTETSSRMGANMMSSVEQVCFLAWMVESLSVKKIVEVGVFTVSRGLSSSSSPSPSLDEIVVIRFRSHVANRAIHLWQWPLLCLRMDNFLHWKRTQVLWKWLKGTGRMRMSASKLRSLSQRNTVI